MLMGYYTRAVLSQGEACDAAANFDRYQIFNGIVWFLCHSTPSATIQMLKLHTIH